MCIKLALLSAYANIDKSKSADCVGLIKLVSSFPLENATSQNATIRAYSHDNDKVKTYVARAERSNKNQNNWEELDISFYPSSDGEVWVSLNVVKPENKEYKKSRLAVYFDDLKLNDNLVKNGDFENGITNFSFSTKIPPRIEVNPEIVKFGKSCLRLCSSSYLSLGMNVKKGEKYTVSVMMKAAGELLNDDDILLALPDVNKAEHIKLTPDKFGEVVFDTIRFNANNPIKSTDEVNITPEKTVVGKYVYILHSLSNCGFAQNSDAGRVFIKTKDGKQKKHVLYYGVDMVDENRYEPASNAKAVYFARPKNKKGALYLSRFEVGSNSPIESITINGRSGFEWNIAAVTISDKKVKTFEVWTPTPEEWLPADIPEDARIIKGSALDLSGFLEDGEAGQHGRVIISKRGKFAFEKSPDKDIRFKSFQTEMGFIMRFAETYEERKAIIADYAKQIRLAGYNAIRINFDYIRAYQSKDKFEENLDLVDFYMAEMKKNGIYVHYTIGWNNFGLNPKDYPEMRDAMKMSCVMNKPDVLAAWKKWAEFHLNHVNPYTKLALKDDPQIIQVEYFNELSISRGRIERMPDDGREWVLNKFHNWLKEKYGTIENLNKAWNEKGFVFNSGSFKYKDFAAIRTFFVKNPDWCEFYDLNKRKFFDFCTEVVKGTGYKGIISSENIGGTPEQSDIQNKFCHSTIINTYFDHPMGINTEEQAVDQVSAIGTAFPIISGLCARHFNNRPIGITEYNHCFWNKYRYEVLSTFVPYCSFQDYSMITLHEGAVPNLANMKYKRIRKMSPFRSAFSPIMRANEVFTSGFFLRGDIKPAKNRIEMEVTKDFLKNEYRRAQKAFNITQTRLGLLTGFRVDCEGEPPTEIKEVRPIAPAMKIQPIGSSDTKMDDWFQSVVEDSASVGFDIVDFSEKMRKRGILGEDNKTNIKKGIFHTDTEQIYMNVKKKFIKIKTPKSELIATNSGKKSKLDNLRLISSSTPASVGVMSLDGKDIEKSSRLMLCYATQEANSGMMASFDQKNLFSEGSYPVLLKTGKLKATLRLDSSKKYTLYPLALSGERRAPIPTSFEDGELRIEIDTATLPNGATTMFEIVSE